MRYLLLILFLGAVAVGCGQQAGSYTADDGTKGTEAGAQTDTSGPILKGRIVAPGSE